MTDATETAYCSSCGASANGKFCSQCGMRLGDDGCSACGAKLSPGAMYCGECGQSVRARETKPRSAALPWLLCAIVLVGFSIVISQLVQNSTRPRVGEMTITGSLPGEAEGPGPMSGGAGTAPGGAGGRITAEELAAMSPRQAADRLFERAMREHEGGDFEQAAFFLNMGLQAYGGVPPDDIDQDARFHMGLMHYFLGDTTSARLQAEDILGEEADNLLGLVLSARVAEFRGDADAADGFRQQLISAVDSNGGELPDRPEYKSHRPLIDAELEQGR